MDKISNSPINTVLTDITVKQPMKYANSQIDLKELYSEEELDNILAKFECLHRDMPNGKKCEFDVIYLPKTEHLIINNRNMTNDTVEISKSGKAISVGSWHRKELNGDYSDILKDAKIRLEQQKQNGNAKLTSELDALSTLGKSQVATGANKVSFGELNDYFSPKLQYRMSRDRYLLEQDQINKKYDKRKASFLQDADDLEFNTQSVTKHLKEIEDLRKLELADLKREYENYLE